MKLALALLLATNLARVAAGVPAINEDKYLDTHAQQRAEYLCATHTFTHTGWNSKLFWDYGHMKYTWQGENLAQGFQSKGAFVPDDIEAAFMASPEHKANILEPKWNAVGFGSACNIVVEEFGGVAN